MTAMLFGRLVGIPERGIDQGHRIRINPEKIAASRIAV
jgi:hypothetical protein